MFGLDYQDRLITNYFNRVRFDNGTMYIEYCDEEQSVGEYFADIFEWKKNQFVSNEESNDEYFQEYQ